MPEPATKPALIEVGAQAIDKAADQLRGRVDLFGKTLAAIATVGTGAVGLSTISDLAPLRGWLDWTIAIAAVLCLLAAAIAAVDVAIRLMQVGQPVVIDLDSTAQTGVSAADGQDVARIFAQSAHRFGFESLAGVQERERSLRAAAARASTDDERMRRTALADELRSETDLAASRARLAIIRRRSTDAVSGSRSRAAYGVVAAGLLVFALLADVVTSDDSEAVATAKACAEAREAGATDADLEATACNAKDDAGGDDPDETPHRTADEVRADLVTQLTAVLTECVSHAATGGNETVERPISDSECTTLRAAIRTLLSP
ncbi:hypothetical protein ACFQW6_07245 [Nocardioides sp. GCM10028917]|uniref:hypothetical protein n=1 Tax=Nocardioides sp. GCM10028917 TaxID=3273408 RepID=UPI003611F2CF